MNKFPKLLDLSLIIAKISGDGPSVIRGFLIERGFSPCIEKGDYVVPDDWDGRPVGAIKAIAVDKSINAVRLPFGCRPWFCLDGFLKVPGEYLVWSDGKDNKTVPLNCENLSIGGLKDPMLEQEGLCQEIPLPLAEDVEYVTCTNNIGVGGCLTIGKEYKVVDKYVRHTGSEFITIIDDNGLENGCYASRFASKKEIKEGEYVTCINSGEMDSLTEMKDYVVKGTYVDEVGLHYVQVIDDSGYEGKYCPSHFIAKEDKGKDRCNFNSNIKSASAKTFKAAASEIRKRVEAGTFKIPAEQVRGAMDKFPDKKPYSANDMHPGEAWPDATSISDSPIKPLYYVKTECPAYVVCPTTGRKLDPNTLILLDEVVTFIDKPII